MEKGSRKIMTINNTRLRKALKKVAQPQTGWLDIFPAVIGKEDGTVLTAIPGEIYVRNVLNGQTLTVHNSVAPNIATLQVEVGRRVERPGLWQIKGIREAFNSPAGGNYISFHGNQHTFPAADTVWIDRKQILALTVLVSDAANIIVKVYGATVRTQSGVALIETQDVDLSSYVPATGALYVNIESDDDGVLSVHAGTGFDAPDLATAADVPVPAAGKYMLAFVLLTEGMTELSNDNIRVPIALDTDYAGVNTGAQIHAASASAVTDSDEFGFWEDVSVLLKKITWTNIKATLKTYFDTLYAAVTFKTIAVSGQSDVVADSITDTLTLVAGTNITITTDAGADSVTIAAAGGSAHVIQEEGTPLTARANLNFVGAGVTVTDDAGNNQTDVIILGDGWFGVTATWTRTGNYTFTVSGDVTTVYRKSAKIRYKDGGTFEYGVIGSSSYSAPNTTINLIPNTDYAMAAATITDTYISYVETPEGFPLEFNFTPSPTNLTVGDGTYSYAKWSTHDNLLYGRVHFVFGSTSSISGTVDFAVPFAEGTYTASASRPPIGIATFLDASVAAYLGNVVFAGSGVMRMQAVGASGTYANIAGISSTVPFTWGTSDELSFFFQYSL
jgi:preprotein translocase subunit SecE